MRYVPDNGNVIDASTIRRTLLELEGMGISVGGALLNAGYYNGKNTDALYKEKISFVTRVHNKNKVFTDAVKMYRTGLESKENLIRHYGGLYYIRQVSVMLGTKSDRKAYGYLCLDLTTRQRNCTRSRPKLRKWMNLRMTPTAICRKQGCSCWSHQGR